MPKIRRRRSSFPLVIPTLMLFLLGGLFVVALEKQHGHVLGTQSSVDVTPTIANVSAYAASASSFVVTPTAYVSSPPARVKGTVSPVKNLLLNSGFEDDADHDGSPDSWTLNAHVTRSNDAAVSGRYAMKHTASTTVSYAVLQDISSITAGKQYSFNAWINMPAQYSGGSFLLQVQWANDKHTIIRTVNLKSFYRPTNGWNYITIDNIFAPPGAVSAQIVQRADRLRAIVYVDNFLFFQK